MDDKNIVDLYWERSETAISETAISETAISETANKYGRYCRNIAFNILSNYADVEECENDTYVAMWNTIPPTRPNKLSTFLGRLTRNIALDRYDYNTAKKRNGKFDAILSELGDCVSSPDTVESEYESGQTAKVISDFLRTIDADSRMIFIRRYWYSDSIKSISNRFGISDSKVKSVLFRTRNKFKLYLENKEVIL